MQGRVDWQTVLCPDCHKAISGLSTFPLERLEAMTLAPDLCMCALHHNASDSYMLMSTTAHTAIIAENARLRIRIAELEQMLNRRES